MWEYVDDCIVMGEGVERSIAPRAVATVAAHDDLKEGLSMLEGCKEEARGSPGSRLDGDGGQYQNLPYRRYLD